MSFPAQYPGTCGLCYGRFAEGDQIRRLLRGFAHETCPDVAAIELAAGETVCSRCRLVHRGECA